MKKESWRGMKTALKGFELSDGVALGLRVLRFRD